MRRWLVRGVVGAAVVVAAAQVVPYGRDHRNPAVERDTPWPTARSREAAVAACYDCHSNETRWPWYSAVAPMSWLVQRDVANGRDELNFSSWPDGVDADDAAEAVVDGTMPPRQYLLAHPAARLSPGDRRALVDALLALDEE